MSEELASQNLRENQSGASREQQRLRRQQSQEQRQRQRQRLRQRQEEGQRQRQRQRQRENMLPPVLSQEEQKQKRQHQFKKSLSVHTMMSIPFLALNHYDNLFLFIYFVIGVALLIYKNIKYPFPGYALSSSAIILVMLFFTQFCRYSLAKKAVTYKQSKYIGAYMVSSGFILLSYVFMLRLQTYVLLIEVVTNSVGIGLIFFELLVGIWVFKVYYSKKQRR